MSMPKLPGCSESRDRRDLSTDPSTVCADTARRRCDGARILWVAHEPARTGTSLTMSTATVSHHYSSTGLANRKITIWAFIGSECMLFVSLISTYLIYKDRSVVGPYPHTPWTDPSTGHV